MIRKGDFHISMLRLFSRNAVLRRQACRGLFIGTESTPNPHSLKFLPEGKEVLPEKFGTGMYYQQNQIKQILLSPLARNIFAVGGVKSLFYGRDFISVTKESSANWVHLKPQIFTCILDFYSDDAPIISEHNQLSDTAVLESDGEVVAAIKELIETKVRPSVQEDGGDIFYAGFDAASGLVRVRLAGSCVGCPSSSVTLRNGVEKMLMHYIPEVKGIEEVPPEEGEEEAQKEAQKEVEK